MKTPKILVSYRASYTEQEFAEAMHKGCALLESKEWDFRLNVLRELFGICLSAMPKRYRKAYWMNETVLVMDVADHYDELKKQKGGAAMPSH